MTTADPKNLESKLQSTQSTGDDPGDTKNITPEQTTKDGPLKAGHTSDAQMSIDEPTHDDKGAPPELPPPPAYQPRDMNKNIPHTEKAMYPGEQNEGALGDVNRKWHDSPGNGSDLVGHSSGDDYSDEDDLGPEDDELEDDQYFEDDDYSDDIQEMDDLTHPKDTYDYGTRGPYLKSHQHAGHVRKLGASHIQRKRPLLLKTGSDVRLETSPVPTVDPSTATAEQQFFLVCNDVTRQMHQGDVPQLFQGVKTAMDQAIERRKDEAPEDTQQHSPSQLRILESTFFGVWAKLLLERRPGPHPGPIIEYLRGFIELGCLIIQQDNDLPETYAQALAMMLEPGDLEIYRRPKRPARLSHERVARFSDYSEYGLDDDELSPLQQEFQRLFVTVGGMEACLGAIENQVEDPERNDAKLKTVLLLLTLVSRSQLLARESDQSTTAGDDFTKRLTAAILGYFPDHLDGFKSVNKSVILNIISLVGQFLIENHRSPILSPGYHHETDFDYDFEQDPISRSNVSEIKYSDFRLEMAVRLMKTTRLDLRLAGLIELKEVLVRIQRLQQNRSRLRRRSDSDMDVVEADKKPIESTDVLVFLVQTKVFTIGDLDLIWASVGGNQHRSIVYGVYQVLSDLSSKLPQEYLRRLFNKLQTAPLENWDQQLVDLARSMFLSMVQRAKYNPRNDSINGSGQIILVLAPMQGMDLVWKVALHAQSPNVGLQATDFLSQLIKSYPEQDDMSQSIEAVREFREGLVETCVGHLVASSERLSNVDPMELTEVSLEFERCIGILKAFLTACNSEMTDGSFRPEIHGTLDEDVMLTLKINASNSHFQLSAHPSGTLSTLRRSIAVRLGCSDPEDIRIFYHGKDFSISIDHKTLEELNVESGQTFLASKRPTSNVFRQMSVQRQLPTDLLLKPGFFERIRQILLLDEKYASQAWDIVTRLPTSPVLLQSFQNFKEDVDWNVLLDARSPFLLLYSLQILNFLIKEDQLQDSVDQKWTKKFVELGGQQYLITLLMSDSGLGSSNTSPTARKALGLMLKVLVRLTDSSEIESESLSISGLTVPVFISKLVAEILTSAARAGSHSSNDQSIVLNATSLISHFCAGPLGWQYFQACPDIRSLIFVSMVKSDSAQIRQIVLEMGRKFCMQNIATEGATSPVIFFLDILQSFLPLSKEYESNCSELFGFFEAVAREAARYCSEEYFKNLYTKLMETIINHPTAENSSSFKEDTVMVGMLKVATAMINTDPRLKRLDTDFRIIDYVFDECLFPQMPSPELNTSSKPVAAKCQSDASRAAAFEFLEESTRSTLHTLCYVVKKTHEHFQREHDMADLWGYDPQTFRKARCGFVGLQNLGATCYVNSIVQQFFMNKDFRTGILDAPTDESDSNRNDTLLYQLQLLFGNLQESMRRSYNAHGFCYAYKDWDGNPMNVAVQMDVDEFFNILFDRLESSVKSTPQEELFKKQYGGKLVQQIKSKDCEHISEREDSFFSIQCEVKNKKSLEESLQLYVQGEILDGDNKYKCSSCDKHVDAIKRACIKELPQNLILHLKRFDYDMDTMRRIKINDRFEFPTRLDMEPYTLDYLTRKEQAQEGGVSSPSTHLPEHSAAFQYNLVGVLVHTGTADSGHYYSYIKDRGLEGAENTLWYHFNDSKVEEFDPSEIPSKAFGGPEYIPSESPYLKNSPRMTTKPYSAYMLFYERADAPHPKLPMAIESKVPADIKDVVVKENIILMKDLAVFDRLYYRFVWDLFHMYESLPQDNQALAVLDEQPESLSMRYGLDFFFTVLIHARDVDQELQRWGRFLSSVLSRYPKGCSDFLYQLTQHPVLFSSVLLYCPINQVREAVVDLVFEALHELRQDRETYGLVSIGDSSTTEELGEDGWYCACGSPVLEMITFLLKLLPDARTNWRNFDEYFKLMYNITQLGRAERVAMIQMGYIAELVEFYISDEKFDFKKKMGDKFTKPAFQFLLLTVQELVCTCDPARSYQLLQEQTGHGSNVHRGASTDSSSSTSSALSSPSSEDYASKDDMLPSSVEPNPVLSKADLAALYFSQGIQATNEHTVLTIKKMVADRVDSAIISKIVCHLAAHDYLGTKLMESLANNLDYGHEDRCGVILQVFKDVVQIEDDLLERRVDFILGQVTKFLEMSPHGASAYDCLEFFRAITDYTQCGRFAQAWLLRNSRAWLQELLIVQADSETRARARLFYMELLGSERAFNGWTDEEAATASSEHFVSLLQILSGLPNLLTYLHNQPRGEDDECGWRFVDYFRMLTELVRGDRERDLFYHSWKPFLEVLSRLDSQQLNLDYDKKEMMVFWNQIMNDNVERNSSLAVYKLVGTVLRKFYVCLQNNPVNMQFHREVLPIYFGLVLRFSYLSKPFLHDWVQCHNFTWALGAMKWGAFSHHCPQELNHLLEYTLLEFPQYREECWRQMLSPEAPRFHFYFTMLARALFDPGNEISGTLFFRHGGLNHLTEAMRLADQGTVTNENDFYNVDALSLLCDYLTRMHVCHNTPSFAFAMDHWSNIDTCIEILLGNLSFNTPRPVYQASIDILKEIVNEARSIKTLPILEALDTSHCQWRDSYEGGPKHGEVQTVFGGLRSPFCQYGVVEAPQIMSGVGFAPVRIGPVILVHPELLKNMSALPPSLLTDWYLPYWELARSICKLDRSHNKHKAIELAALLAMEQLAVGSLIHFEVLCEAAEQAEKDADVALSLQNPYVTMFVERLLNRTLYLDLKEHHLAAGTRLIDQVATYMDKAVVDFLAPERLVRIESILESQGEDEEATSTLAEVDLQHITTCLQNFKMLGLESKDDKTFETLSRLYDRIRFAVASAPAPYHSLLSGLLQLTPREDKEVDESGDSTLNEGTSSSRGGAGSVKDLSANTSAEDIVVLSPGPSAANTGTDEDVNMVAVATLAGGDEVVVEETKAGSAGELKEEKVKKAGLKTGEPEVVAEV
ncbi:hypothetical protein BGZ81_004061 [Podila clonocystis]|nr:hypothetical protein BGZ81_004061 [Podila clonocystis]